ncbi:hypothetical protein ACHAXN_008281 [Cyclotella atomus]
MTTLLQFCNALMHPDMSNS